MNLYNELLPRVCFTVINFGSIGNANRSLLMLVTKSVFFPIKLRNGYIK